MVTQQEIAKVFGVSRQSIHEWTRAGMPTRRESGSPRYVVAECVQWRRDQDRADRPALDLDEAKERARKLKEDADGKALDNARKRRELVPSHQVAAQWERVLGLVRSRVLAARGRWAPKVMGLGTMAEATAVLDQLADDLLAALRKSADELEDEDDEAAA
jgi:phage terminase Nu1 subunit (DNA packaging protein)